MPMTPSAALDALRAELGIDVDGGSQPLDEHWLKQDLWRARTQALPLGIGCDPALWTARPADNSGGEAANTLWWSLAADLQCEVTSP